MVVLGLTAVLVNTTPAKAAFAPPYSGRSEAGPVTVQVDIYPARKGRNGLHIYTVGAGGRTRDVAEVTGYVERGKERLTLNAKRKSLGHYEDLALILPAKGDWTIDAADPDQRRRQLRDVADRSRSSSSLVLDFLSGPAPDVRRGCGAGRQVSGRRRRCRPVLRSRAASP